MEMEFGPPRWLRVLGIFFYIIVCVGAGAAGALYGWANKSSLMTTMASQQLRGVEPAEIFKYKNTINLLVIGADENRYYATRNSGKSGQLLKSRGRSDVLKLYHIDFENKKITGLAIPRDLYHGFRDHKPRKINGYYEDGGPELAKEAVESLLGVFIDKVIDLKYTDFASIVDAIGGVEVLVDKPLEYDDVRGDLHIHLQPGWQKLTGEEAIGFVRFRKHNRDFLKKNKDVKPDTDFDRQRRQQHLMLQLKKTIESNPRLLPLVANAAQQVIGDSLNTDELAALILFGRKVGQTNIHTEEMKATDIPGTYNLEFDPEVLNEQLVRLNFIPKGLR